MKKYLILIFLAMLCENSSAATGQAYMPFWRVFQSGGSSQFHVLLLSNITDASVSVKVSFFKEDGTLLKGIPLERAPGVSNLNINPVDGSATFDLASKTQVNISIFSQHVGSDTNGWGVIEWFQDSTNAKALIGQAAYVKEIGNPGLFAIDINGGLPF